MNWKNVFLWVCVGLWSNILFSQKSFDIHPAEGNIKIDGLEDSSWFKIPAFTNFQQHLPVDTALSLFKTEVKMTYDDKFLYLFAKCFQEIPKKFIVQSLKRDFSYPRTDAFVVFIDPFNDGQNGFSFACNPYGAQREGLLELGGQFGVTTSWDNKWYSETKIEKDSGFWVVEMAIPFSSLRYNESNKIWKVNFSRNNLKANEASSWVTVPRNFNVANLAYTAQINWQINPPKSGRNISLIPYLIGGITDDELTGNAGLDAKVGVTSALNLDLTFNPNFSTVEVDVQQTNLDRFELFFPERRQFFIENSDLFTSLGSSNTRPFFSRRIGIGRNAKGENLEQPILFGARLSGRLNGNWRLGLMNVQTGNGSGDSLDPENFSILSVQRNIFSRSNVGFFLMNKEVYNPSFDRYTKNSIQIGGLEANINSKNSRWQGKAYFHNSLDSNRKIGTNQGANLQYGTKKFTVSLYQEWVSNAFNSEMGFIRRKDYFLYQPFAQYLFYPKSKKIIYHGPNAGHQQYFELNFKTVEFTPYVGYKLQFKNTATLSFSLYHNDLILQRAFDPSASNGKKLEVGREFSWQSSTIQYLTDERKVFFSDIKVNFGEYFLGDRFSIIGTIRYRFVPKVVLSMNYSYDKIDQPSPYNSREWWLIGPQTEILFSTKLFWTTYIQYNQQQDNINVNSRIQWRFKPASDLFLVYTNNFSPDNLTNKNRGIVVKFTYWFNL